MKRRRAYRRQWKYEGSLLLYSKIGETYNVGSNKNFRNIDLAKKILLIMRKKLKKIGKNSKIKYVKDRPGHDYRYALNSKKIYKTIKWKAKINIYKGLKAVFL